MMFFFASKSKKMMQIKAKLIELLPLQTGESKNGTWKSKVLL